MTTITPFIWFDGDAEEAFDLYLLVFPDSEVVNVVRDPEGKMFIGTFRLLGQELIALNAGPAHPHTEAFSLFVNVETQEQIDTISDQLIGENGHQDACGWLKDNFGLSWQVVPSALMELITDPDPARSGRVNEAMQQMKRIDIAGLRAAYDGES